MLLFSKIRIWIFVFLSRRYHHFCNAACYKFFDDFHTVDEKRSVPGAVLPWHLETYGLPRTGMSRRSFRRLRACFGAFDGRFAEKRACF